MEQGRLEGQLGHRGQEKVEFENEHVRVTRVRSGSHEKREGHARLDRVLVWLTDSHELRRSPDGGEHEVTHRAGDVAFRKASEHALENLEDKPIELLVIELKHAE
jgi:hypothetical protein